MDLRQRLREETMKMHDAIEQTFLLKKILQQKLSLND
jgi:hypothetical protein